MAFGRPHPRSAEAAQYRKLYADTRWTGPSGVRRQAFRRDLYTCQRCSCIVVEGIGMSDIDKLKVLLTVLGRETTMVVSLDKVEQIR